MYLTFFNIRQIKLSLVALEVKDFHRNVEGQTTVRIP